MDKRIEDILKDLYKIDPKFKAQQTELRKVIAELVMLKPDTQFDAGFASHLRTQLLNTRIKPMPVRSPYTSIFVSRAFYGIIGSALTILIVVPFTYIATQKATSPNKPVVLNPFSPQPVSVKDVSSGLSPKQQISNKGINAFGKLALLPTDTTAPVAQTATLKTSVGVSSYAASVSHASNSVGYKGNDVALKNEQGKIFKRTKGIDSGKQLTDIIKQGSFDLTNLSSFGDLSLKNLTLAEDKTDGYMLSVNFDEGAISVTPNTKYWSVQSLENATSTLDGTTLIAIADDFIKAHNVDTSVYGKSVLLGTNQVVYPLIIDTKEVLESDGTPFGLILAINPKEKKVSAVSNMTSQTYDSSLYDLETNFTHVVSAATSTFSVSGVVAESTSAHTASTTINLGTPQAVLMHYWMYDEASTTPTELFIPALAFPVSYKDTHYEKGPTRFVVPVVKDFLTKFNSTGSTKPNLTLGSH